MQDKQEFTHDDFEFTAEIAAGVAWLDDHKPGWRDEIDTETLDMRMPSTCILGQLYGSYWGCIHNGELCGTMTHYEALERGFTVTGEYEERNIAWEKLTMQWTEILAHSTK